MKYRIQENNGQYRIQRRRWWWPFWSTYKTRRWVKCPIFGRFVQVKKPKIFDSFEKAHDVKDELWEETNSWQTVNVT